MNDTTPRPAPAPSPAEAAGQQALPFDPSPLEPLPFDDESDHPIPFSLTARARLEVAPDGLPPLAVVRDDAGTADDGSGDLDEPGDTRPARARALRRAGMTPTAIADKLAVDELSVRAWIGDVAVAHRTRQGGRSGSREDTAETKESEGAGTGDGRAEPGSPEEHHLAFELARAAARDTVTDRLASDAGFAAGVGLVAALAEVDAHAVTVTTPDQAVAAHLLRWLASCLDLDARRVRVVLRLGTSVSGDLARHRWAKALHLPLERIAHTRRGGPATPDGVEALVRVADPVVAATLAGWRDALLSPDDGSGPADVAF